MNRPILHPLRRAVPFSVLLFLLVGAHSLLETSRDSLFLTGQPISRLPWVFLGVTVVVLALTPVQRRLWGARHRSALAVTLLGAGVVTVVFWLARSAGGAVLLFYVWTSLFSSLVFVQFWLTADEAFGLGEAKAVFGFIGAGGLLGAVAGSGAARLVLQFAPPAVLMPGSAVVTLLAAVLASVIGDVPAARVAEPDVTVARAVPSAIRRDPYLRLLAALALLTAASATLLDYLFKSAVVATTAPDRIPRLVANVNVGQSLLAVAVELLLVRFLLGRAGVTRTLALLPVLALAGAAGYAVLGVVRVLFVLKMLDGGLRPSIYRVGTELLYLPVRPAERRIIKPSIDTLAPRLGQALASLLLLSFAQMPSRAQLLPVAIAMAAVSLGWVVATWALRRRYLVRFQQQLGTGTVEMRGRAELDLPSAEILVAALGSPRTPEVVTAIDLLAGAGRPGLIPALILYHPDPVVVTAALRQFARARRPDVAAMLPFLIQHSNPDVRAAAASRWLQSERPVGELRALLEDREPRVRASALLALAGAPEGGGAFLDQAFSVVREGSVIERRALAWAIASAPRADLLPLLMELFAGGDVEIRRELLRVVREFPAPPARFVSETVEMLGQPELRSGAEEALVAMGGPAREELERLLLSEETSFALARHLPEALAKFPAGETASILVRRLAQRRGGLDRFRSLRALNELRRADPRLSLDRHSLETALDFEIRSATKDRRLRTTGERLGIAGSDEAAAAGRLLLDLLQDKEARALERVFRCLDLLLPGRALQRVYLGLRSVHPDRREAALEVLVELLPPRRRAEILTVVAPGAGDPPATAVAPGAFVADLLEQSSEMVRLLTPCVAEERGWVDALPALRTGPRCVEDHHAARADAAIRELESRVEAAHV